MPTPKRLEDLQLPIVLFATALRTCSFRDCSKSLCNVSNGRLFFYTHVRTHAVSRMYIAGYDVRLLVYLSPTCLMYSSGCVGCTLLLVFAETCSAPGTSESHGGSVNGGGGAVVHRYSKTPSSIFAYCRQVVHICWCWEQLLQQRDMVL